jgi:hypothetical protein
VVQLKGRKLKNPERIAGESLYIVSHQRDLKIAVARFPLLADRSDVRRTGKRSAARQALTQIPSERIATG